MQTQVQSIPQNEAADLLSSLLAKEFVPSAEYKSAPTVVEPTRKWVVTGEIRGEVDVERELDYSISVCAICGLGSCSCQPRRLISVRQVLRYPVETTLATQVTLR